MIIKQVSGMKKVISLNIREKQEALEVINYQIRSCEKCSLSVTRKHALTGEGNLNARIFLIGLSPGAQENLGNRMFIGPSGHVLERLFHASGIHREQIYMTNLIKCMLPGNRRPQVNEIEMCSHYLEDELTIIQPEVIVPLGRYAATAILNSSNAEFGKLQIIDDRKIYPLSHPASLLYNPSYEPDTIEKYKNLKAFL